MRNNAACGGVTAPRVRTCSWGHSAHTAPLPHRTISLPHRATRLRCSYSAGPASPHLEWGHARYGAGLGITRREGGCQLGPGDRKVRSQGACGLCSKKHGLGMCRRGRRPQGAWETRVPPQAPLESTAAAGRPVQAERPCQAGASPIPRGQIRKARLSSWALAGATKRPPASHRQRPGAQTAPHPPIGNRAHAHAHAVPRTHATDTALTPAAGPAAICMDRPWPAKLGHGQGQGSPTQAQ